MKNVKMKEEESKKEKKEEKKKTRAKKACAYLHGLKMYMFNGLFAMKMMRVAIRNQPTQFS